MLLQDTLHDTLRGIQLEVVPESKSEYDLKPLGASRFPEGWALISVTARCANKWPPMTVQIYGADSSEPRFSFLLKQDPAGSRVFGITKLFRTDSHLKLEIMAEPQSVTVVEAGVRGLSRAEAATRLFLPKVAGAVRSREGIAKVTTKALALWKRGGWRALKRRMSEEVHHQFFKDDYSRWVHMYDTLKERDRKGIRARIEQLRHRPRISIVMPVYNVDERWLRRAVESVRNQLYPDWELCIADDKSTQPHVRRVLEELSAADSRIRVVFREVNGHISEASNSALGLATGEFVALLDNDDELAEHALYLIAEELDSHPDADLIYSDEDKIDEFGWRFYPYFKSDWNPDLFYSHNMVSHLGVYRASLLREIGGFRKGFEGSQDYDLALRVIERTTPEKIRHIPHVLYHWRSIPGSLALGENEKNYATDAARRALYEHFKRRGIEVEIKPGIVGYHQVVYPLPAKLPMVSLIVCTRDALELLRGVVTGILKETDYPSFELIIVDNQSQKPETLEYFKEISSDPRVRVLKYDAPFNFSAMNNYAVQQSKGEVVLLINNDMKMIHPEWLTEMVRHAVRPDVGAVGAKLYYPNDTIQHGGVIVGLGGVACHGHKDFPRDAYGYVGRARLTQNLSAVTAACIASRRQVWDEVGGLNEVDLRVAFNDVDYCLKLRDKGYLIVWTPFAELYHLESATRGSDMAPDKRARFMKEIDFMQEKWGHIIERDPYYSPNLTIGKEDFSLAFPPRAPKPWRET